MEAYKLGEFIGEYSILIIWLGLNGYAMYKSYKRKQNIWLVCLVISFISGFFLSALLTFILPVVYLVINIKKK